MTRWTTTLLVVVSACGAPVVPAPAARTVAPTAGDVPAHAPPPDLTFADAYDGGLPALDAGVCCPVRFAVHAVAGDVEGRMRVLTFPSEFPLARDGGAWGTTACLPLVPLRYYFAFGVEAQSDDGGLAWVSRVNAGVPSEVTGLVPAVNVFDPGAAASCAAVDAGVYAVVP